MNLQRVCYLIISQLEAIAYTRLLSLHGNGGYVWGGGYVTDESVKAINLLFAWQILEMGSCPLTAVPIYKYFKELFLFNTVSRILERNFSCDKNGL